MQLRDRRRAVLAAEARVAAELDYDAELVERRERGYHTHQEMFKLLRFEAWDAEIGELHVLDTQAPGLWAELELVYSGLRAAEWGGSQNATAAQMRELATRLRAAGY